jgi:ABC-type lipoprotein export system ATPase subunit
MTQSNSILAVKKLSKAYEKDRPILTNIDFQVNAGDRIAILGASGSGKSTLLNLLALLDSGEGQINYTLHNHTYQVSNGQLIEKPAKESTDSLRSQFGFVFQTPFMLNNFDVRYNVSLPLRLQKVDEASISHKADEMIRKLGKDIQQQANKTADVLSGGQRQRVAVGRALIHEPKIVFADEPTGNLDPKTAIEVMNTLEEVCQSVSGAALLLVTHDLCLALKYTNKMYLLAKGCLYPLDLPIEKRHTMNNACQALNAFISSAIGELSR